jgi:hypothetical protein
MGEVACPSLLLLRDWSFLTIGDDGWVWTLPDSLGEHGANFQYCGFSRQRVQST